MISAGAIVLLVVEVPIDSFFVTMLFGFVLALVIALMMLSLVWLVFREPPVFRGPRNSAGVVGLAPPVGCLIALVVEAGVTFPTHGTGAELVLVFALSFTVLMTLGWMAVMFAMSIAERAWTTPSSVS